MTLYFHFTCMVWEGQRRRGLDITDLARTAKWEERRRKGREKGRDRCSCSSRYHHCRMTWEASGSRRRGREGRNNNNSSSSSKGKKRERLPCRLQLSSSIPFGSLSLFLFSFLFLLLPSLSSSSHPATINDCRSFFEIEVSKRELENTHQLVRALVTKQSCPISVETAWGGGRGRRRRDLVLHSKPPRQIRA